MLFRSPAGFSALEGVATNLTAAAVGEQPLSLQWLHDDAPVPGATAPTLPLPSLSVADAGRYALVASNAFGMATSLVARVTVYPVRPNWLVITNATTAQTFANTNNPLRPNTVFKVVPDGARGVVVASPKGVERWNDAGQRLWTARYVEADFGALNAMAVDA